MVEMTELERQRRADRQLALLALTGEQPRADGPCPKAEELAALVEGKLPAEEAEACLTHLAGCGQCYSLWLQLDREYQEHTARQRPPLLHLLSRPRLLTAAGSLLAAAASIALFLNLTTRVDRSSLTILADKPVAEQIVSTAPAPEHPSSPLAGLGPMESATDQWHRAEGGGQRSGERAEVEKLTGRQPAGPTEDRGVSVGAERAKPAPAMVAKERREQKKVPPPKQEPVGRPAADDGELATKQQEVMASFAAPQATMPAAVPMAEPARKQEPLSLEEWQDGLRRQCTAKPEADFVATMTARGRLLLEEPDQLSARDRQRIERLLAELGKEQPAELRCRALLDILGPAPPDSRR